MEIELFMGKKLRFRWQRIAEEWWVQTTIGTEEQGKVFVKKITSCFIQNYWMEHELDRSKFSSGTRSSNVF